MTTTLVSFLGRARQDPKTGYREATYRFPDGRERTTAYFGIALREVLSPDKLVLLGTSGSMWDFLVEHLATEGQEEELRLRLIEAAIEERVTPELLAEVTPLVGRALGLSCTLRLFDYSCDDTADQIAILDAIARTVPNGSIILDLTHGSRDWATRGLLSGFFLERVAHLDIDGLYYGALDRTEAGIAPVISLDGMLAAQRWIDALGRFDQSGNYSVFAPLLEADGMPADKARCLTRAAYFEQTMNLAHAKAEIDEFRPALVDPLPGASGLFQYQLSKRLDWVGKDTLFDRQSHLARFFLAKGDYVRAAAFGYEAVVTRECLRRGLDPNDYKVGRLPAAARLGADHRGDRYSADKRDAYKMLKTLRNSLAHGTPSANDDCNAIIADPERLPKELERAMDRMLNERKG